MKLTPLIFNLGGPELFIILLFVVFFAILPIIAMWMIFEKAGKPGWASIIPIYNILVLLEIIGKPWWWLFLIIIPYVGIIWTIWAINLLVKGFGKSEGFTIGVILLPWVFLPLLGFGDARYIGHSNHPIEELV